MRTAKAVKERALRLNDGEVRSVLTMPEVVLYLPIKLNQFQRSQTPGYDWTFRCKRGLWQDYREADLIAQRCPHGKPGERLAVKETFLPCKEVGNRHPISIKEATYVCFRDGSQKFRAGSYYQEPPRTGRFNWPCDAIWRSSAVMPRWASRINFELTAVGIQQLAAEDLWILSLRRLESAS